MSDHEVDTINQLREVLKDLQRKLDSRTRMLATITPHLLACHESGDDIENYIIFEFFERHEADLREFREEYGKETAKVQPNKDSQL